MQLVGGCPGEAEVLAVNRANGPRHGLGDLAAEIARRQRQLSVGGVADVSRTVIRPIRTRRPPCERGCIDDVTGLDAGALAAGRAR